MTEILTPCKSAVSPVCFVFAANTTRRGLTITYPGQHTWDCLHINNVLNDYRRDKKWTDKQINKDFFFIMINCGKILKWGEGKS